MTISGARLRRGIVGVLALASVMCLGWGIVRYYVSEKNERIKLQAQVTEALARADRAERTSKAAIRSARSAPPSPDEQSQERDADSPEQAFSAEPARPPRPRTLEEDLAQSDAMFGRLDAILRAETRDNAWSNDVETSLARIYSDQKFAKSRLERLECRQTLCKMEASHESGFAFQQWLQQFPMRAHEKGFIKRVVFQKAQPDGTVFSRTIMARPGQDLPPLDG